MYLNEQLKSFCSLLFILLCFSVKEAFSEKDITVTVPAGAEECFYESLKSGQAFDIDYQVIDGGQGSFEISFLFESPSGRTIIMDYKKPEKTHRIEIEEDGDYKLCFDNKFSSFNAKTVFFEIIIENETGEDVDLFDFGEGTFSPAQQYEMAIQDIEESVKKVKSHLLRIRHLQEAVRAFATRDKNVLESNFFKVNSWSILQVIIMICVGLIQVVMVKGLFDEQSKVHKIWKKTFS